MLQVKGSPPPDDIIFLVMYTTANLSYSYLMGGMMYWPYTGHIFKACYSEL